MPSRFLVFFFGTGVSAVSSRGLVLGSDGASTDRGGVVGVVGVTFVAGVGDISTDLLSPGGDAHSRSDRQLHGQSMFEHNKEKQKALLELQANHPDKRVMLIAEKGTMGVGSSRMSGVNNVALWIGKKASDYIPFINIAPVVAGTNGISPIFLTTVGVTGGIGIDLKNWVKKIGEDGKPIINNDGNIHCSTIFGRSFENS